MKWKVRLFWIVCLLLLWLFCSGVALAELLADPLLDRPLIDLEQRLSRFPNWISPPPIAPAKGDLAYPTWFAGEWIVTSTLVDLVAPLAPEVVTPGFEGNRSFLNQPVQFQVRFLEEQSRRSNLFPWSLRPAKAEIISDRAFNGLSLAKAHLGDRVVRTVKVDPTNPNRQITLLRGDRQLVSTVVARATEAPNPERCITTELFRQEFYGSSPPYLNEVENTTAYQWQGLDQTSDQPEITADQVTAIYLSPQDPDYFKTTIDRNPLSAPRPVALYRYHLEFQRPT